MTAVFVFLGVALFILVLGFIDGAIIWSKRPGVVKDRDGRWVSARTYWRRTRR